MTVQIKVDPKTLGVAKRALRRHKKQVPFVLSKAINKTLFEAAKHSNEDIKRYVDRPKPVSANATKYNKSHKTNLRGRVGYLSSGSAPDRWLRPLVKGLAVAPKGRANTLPARTATKDRYGNVTTGKLAHRVMKLDKFFSGKPKGGNRPAGIYQRMGRGGRDKLRPLHFYRGAEPHRRQIPFYQSTGAFIRRRIGPNFRQQWAATVGP